MVRVAPHRLSALAVTVVVACALVACGGDDDTAETTTTTTESAQTSTSTTEPTEPDLPAGEQAVIDAYEAQWADFIKASDPPDPDAAYLSDHMTGKALTTSISEIQKSAAEGVGLRGEFDSRATVVEMTDNSAVVAECGFDRTEVYDLASGEVISGFDENPDTFTANMVLEGGEWKIHTFGTEKPECNS